MARNLTPEAKEIIRDTKITKSDALKLSRLSPAQQLEAASQLVSGDIHSVDEYQLIPVPYSSSGRRYATFEEYTPYRKFAR